MKVMIICADGSNYHRDCWINPLQEIYDTTFISVRILRKYMSAEQLGKHIIKLLKNDNYQYLFVYSDGIRTNVLEDWFYEEARNYCRVITFHADDEPQIWYDLNRVWDYRYEIVFTHSPRAAKLRENGIYLQWGFNPNVHRKIAGIKKEIDVLFIGLNKCKQMALGCETDYYEDGYYRQKLLTEIYEWCKKEGYTFRLYGSGWKYHPVLKECDGGYISDEETIEVINRSKIVINIAFSQDQNENAFQTKLRHFEIGGCGSFQLTNYNPDLEKMYGASVGYVKDLTKINEIISYYLKNENEREMLAEKAYEISLRDHTMQARMVEMFTKASEYFGEPLLLSRSKKLTVKSISIKSRDHIEEIIRKIETNEFECDYIHLYDDSLQLEDLNTTLLELDSNKDLYLGESIISVYSENERNTLVTLRKSFPQEAILLPNILDDNTPDKERLVKDFISLQIDGKTVFLTNAIIKISSAKKILETVIKRKEINDCEYVHNNTVVGDYLYYTEKRYWDVHTDAINKILKKASEGYKVGFYGARDSLARMVVREIKALNNIENIYLIDQNIDGLKEMYGDINAIQTDLVLNEIDNMNIIALTSQRSERIMWEIIQKVSKNTLLLPLFDLHHENWKLLCDY